MEGSGPAGYFHAVVVDYDGTIARAGAVSAEALAAIHDARAGGIRAVLATGRILDELEAVFPEVAEHFDAVVAEDGTVLEHAGQRRLLAPPIPSELTDALDDEGISYRRGLVLLACRGEDDAAILAAVRRLGLDCQLVRNRAELMVLPPGCSKGTGAAAALAELDLSPHNAVGVGDAENDLAMLRATEVGVAVGDAVESLKAHADLVLDGPDGEGVAALVHEVLLPGRWCPRPARWSVELGCSADGTAVCLPASQLQVLVTGGPGSGKSYVAGLLAERLVALSYSVLVMDPEGDHPQLGRLPGVFLTGAGGRLPAVDSVVHLLGHRLGSVVVDLSATAEDGRSDYLWRLRAQVEAQHRRNGLPHWLILDEAHTILGPGQEHALTRAPRTAGYCFVTYRPQDLDPEVLRGLDAVIALPHRAGVHPLLVELASTIGGVAREWVAELLAGAEPGEAVLVRRDRPGDAVVFRPAARATHHVRHWHKYDDDRLPPDRRFHFRVDDATLTGATAGSVAGLARELRRCADATIEHHCAGGDLSRWVDEVLGDWFLAQALATVEVRLARGELGTGAARGRLCADLEARAGRDERSWRDER